MSEPTVYFSGDDGDCIYLLPSLRAIGGAHLRLTPSVNFVRSPYTSQKAESLASLLRLQPYILSCEFAEQPEKGWVNGDAFRPHYRGGSTIVEWIAQGLGCRDRVDFSPWLSVNMPTPIAPVIMHRSGRYQNPSFPWWDIPLGFKDRLTMVGSKEEHQAFGSLHQQAPVPYHHTPDFLSLAGVIAGCQLFIGNQSAPMAVALGLGVTVVQETCGWTANCCVPGRSNAQYIREGWKVSWPLITC